MNTIVVTSTKQNIKFGYEGEDNVTKIIFPYDESWLEYGEGNFEVRILRCGDEVAYTATDVVDDRQAMTLTMTVTDIELSVRGRGEMQLCYVCPDSIKKSPIYQYTVNRSIDYKYAVDPPDGSIIASVEKSLSEIKNTTNRLSNSVISIESSIDDINSQIDNINDKISEFDEEIDSVGEIETKVDNLETSIGNISGRINTAEANINENAESISDLNESVTELENRKVTDLETSGGRSDSGKYLTVGADGKVKATSLTIPTITVDGSLSTTSENPVQNKVIKTELNNINSNIETCNTEISKINGSLGNLGERITDLFTIYNTSNVSITIRKEIRNSDGAVITNAKTAITDKYATRFRAIGMTGDTYQQNVVLYNQSNQYDGLLSDYTNDLVSIPKSALYFRCTFKRKDGADMTSADIQTIRDAIVWYKQTDDSLSVPNIPADSSATGIRFTNVENRVSALEDVTIPMDVKQALLRLLKKATYTSADMSADIRTVQDWVGIQVHYIDVSIKSNAPGTSDGSKKITSTLAYDNALSAVFDVGASVYKVTDTGTHDRFRFYGISADLDVNNSSDFAQITIDRIADATTVSGLDSMTEYTVDNTVTQYKIIFVYLRSNTTEYNPRLVVEEVTE